MSLHPTTLPAQNFIGNGTADQFSFNYRIYNENNIKVTAYDEEGQGTVLEYSTDYTLGYSGFPNYGGAVYLENLSQPWLNGSGKLATGWNLFVEYVPVITQERKFRDYGPRAPLEIEKTLDEVALALMAIMAKVNRALTIPGGVVDADSELPPLIGNARKILFVNDEETGYALGPTVDSIFTALSDAQAAKDDAVAAKTAAETALANAVTAKDTAVAQVALAAAQVTLAQAEVLLAVTARNAAQAAVTAAQAEVVNAQTQVTLALNWSNKSKQYAESSLYGTIVELDAGADSPYAITEADKNKIFNVDCSIQEMVFTLPDMSTLSADFKFATVKREPSLFAIKVNSYFTDTVNGVAFVTVNKEAYGMAIHKVVPGTDWSAKYFILETSGSGGGATAGGYVINTGVQDVPNLGTITLTADLMQWNKVKGDSGPQTTALSPFAASALPGTVITLEGQDDTDYLIIPHSPGTPGGCANPFGGDVVLKAGSTVTYMYDDVADIYKATGGNGI